LFLARGFEVMAPVLNCQQSLLKEDEPRGTGNSPVPASSLKNNRYLSTQQNTRAARDLIMQWGQQLRSGCGDVATQDE
jgi:hypothetical protein